MRQLGKALAVLACIAYPFLLHFLIQGNDVNALHLLLVLMPLLLAGAWVTVRSVRKAWRPVIVLVLLALVYFIVAGQHERIGLIAATGISHASFNLFLLWFFARTLQQGQEPLATQISRRINGDVLPEIARYTRQVTVAWCIFFAAQVAVSLVLYLFAPLAAWSLFINVLNLPLLALMFIAEYAWRIAHFPDHSRTSIFKAIAVYAKDMAAPKKR